MITTIDSLLVKFVNNHSAILDLVLDYRDSNVLKSLSIAVQAPQFITESQSRLLVKILRTTASKLPELALEISASLDASLWSKQFRKITHMRKLYISTNKAGVDHVSVIAIEFTFSAAIRKVLSRLAKDVEGLGGPQSESRTTVAFTEKNIVLLVDALRPMLFTIDEDILRYYDIIKSWSKNDITDQFLITAMTNSSFREQITLDLGIETIIDRNIIHDRSLRYQYKTELQKGHGDTLSEYISNRSSPRVWIDNTQHTLVEVIASLIELRRLPVLVVFEETGAPYKVLQELSNALQVNGIETGVGIYFRLPNDDAGKQFNQLVADQKYNQYLNSSTTVAGVDPGRLPKFFLTTEWEPMSVLSINTSLRCTKTAVYASRSDLIISYTATEALFGAYTAIESLFGKRDVWE
jgi:hypothetical protein